MRDIFIQLDDSIRLEAEVAYPTDTLTGSKANGKFPVLVEFTPYKRAGQERLRHTYLVEHGYIVAQVHPKPMLAAKTAFRGEFLPTFAAVAKASAAG